MFPIGQAIAEIQRNYGAAFVFDGSRYVGSAYSSQVGNYLNGEEEIYGASDI